ncbi:uncharacterized protein BJ171DRAFT_518724 [Polychytrium aggregatum]|uniref:uncharacterized protein n=1 Tax=Polychytrium aggregatum TaxID=110093 RepID=UPI0022FEAB55|nr:uncharacterized protein BJ171DRAFT_518724 [Polychytrium aggregatum]KAI9199307.1 hypothetical protein BJ171DRAFT_518724 [Polychytrium aggregatum]
MPNTLVVFVHGFLSSGESFRRFPEDLLERVNRNTNSTRAFFDTLAYNYSTTGSNDQRVIEFVRFLEERSRSYAQVVLIGHSMGGVLALDAVRRCHPNSDYNRHEGHEQGIDGLYRGAGSPLQQKIHLVISVDSPFFGLHPHVIAVSGARRVGNAINWVSDRFGSAVQSRSAYEDTYSSQETSSSSRSSGWGLLGLAAVATVAVGAAAAYALSSSTRSVQADEDERAAAPGIGHAEFLSPLWNIANMAPRFEDLNNLPIEFHGFYLAVSEFGSSNRSTSLKNFVQIPPDPYRHYFQEIDIQARDEIEAHMGIFRSEFDSAAYYHLLTAVARIIADVL